MASSTHDPVTTDEQAGSYVGAPGFTPDERAELFLLAAEHLVGIGSYWHQRKARDARYTELVRKWAVADPEWTAGMLLWLRGTTDQFREDHWSDRPVRRRVFTGVVEFVSARLAAGADTAGHTDHGSAPVSNRAVVASVLQRADDPGDLLECWITRHGRRIPKPVKRGVADAVGRLYTERALLRYGLADDLYTPRTKRLVRWRRRRGLPAKAVWRPADVLELTHPRPVADWQGRLFRYAIDLRRGRAGAVPEELPMIRARYEVVAGTARRRDLPNSPEGRALLATAGMTPGDAITSMYPGMDAADIEVALPHMDLHCLVRGQWGSEETGISEAASAAAARRLADPAEVARSRVSPFQVWQAYARSRRGRPGRHWMPAVERALHLSLANVPALHGRSLILVDRSASRRPSRGMVLTDQTYTDMYTVFGVALALRAEQPTLVEFGRTSRELPVPESAGFVRVMDAFGCYEGSDAPSAVRRHFAGHDRVLVITGLQAQAGRLASDVAPGGGVQETEIDELVPADVPVYVWTTFGLIEGFSPSDGGLRQNFLGFGEASFGAVSLLEAVRAGDWPWLRPCGRGTAPARGARTGAAGEVRTFRRSSPHARKGVHVP